MNKLVDDFVKNNIPNNIISNVMLVKEAIYQYSKEEILKNYIGIEIKLKEKYKKKENTV